MFLGDQERVCSVFPVKRSLCDSKCILIHSKDGLLSHDITHLPFNKWLKVCSCAYMPGKIYAPIIALLFQLGLASIMFYYCVASWRVDRSTTKWCVDNVLLLPYTVLRYMTVFFTVKQQMWDLQSLRALRCVCRAAYTPAAAETHTQSGRLGFTVCVCVCKYFQWDTTLTIWNIISCSPEEEQNTHRHMIMTHL